MAFRRQLGALADVLLKSHLESNRQADENAMLTQRQKDAASQAALNTLLEKGLGNPSLLDALASANPTLRLPGNIDPRVLLPNQAQVNQGVGQTIRSAKTEAEIPTVEDLVAGANPSYLHNAQPPDIADLMRQRTGKQEAINLAELNAEKPQEFQTVAPNAKGEDVQMGQFVKPSSMLGKPPVQTGLGSKPGEPQGVTIDLEGVGTSLPATRIPGTGEIMYGGRDVRFKPGTQTPWAKVHEPNLFAPIQTGDQYASFNRRAGTAAPTQGPGGAAVPLAETGQTRGMGELSKMLLPHIPTIAADAQELDKRGLFGPLMSRIRQKAAQLGTVDALASGEPVVAGNALSNLADAIKSDPTISTDRLAGKFATELGFLASGTGRAHSRGGAGIEMIDYMKSLLTDSSTLDLFLGRLDAATSQLKDYAQGPNAKPEAPPPPEDLYQQYLKRTKK